MTRHRIRTRMNVNNIHAQIARGIRSGTKQATESLRKTLIQGPDPAVYQSRGGALSTMLELTGLDKYTKSEALLNAWNETLANIKAVQVKNGMRVSLFNSEPLDRGTIWMGLSKPPLFSHPKTIGNDADKWRDLDRTRGSKTRTGIRSRKLGAIIQDGFRPLPSAEARRFVWRQNPYKGYGYWLLYEQGYTGRGVSYKPSNFIHNSYQPILGSDVATMFKPDAKIGLHSFKKFMWENKMVADINLELRK